MFVGDKPGGAARIDVEGKYVMCQACGSVWFIHCEIDPITPHHITQHKTELQATGEQAGPGEQPRIK